MAPEDGGLQGLVLQANIDFTRMRSESKCTDHDLTEALFRYRMEQPLGATAHNAA